MADVAVVVGHHPSAPGALLTLEEMSISEHEFWIPFARELALTLWQQDVATEVVTRPNPQPDQELADAVNETGAACAIELHFNGSDGRARGTEMIHWAGSEGGKALAHNLHTNTVDALDTRPRGLKQKSEQWPFLRLTRMPAVIAEPAFGTFRGDAWRLVTRQADLMEAYRTAIMDFVE